MECIWILGKEGELKFEDGYIQLTEEFVPVGERVDDNQVVEAKTPNTVEADVQFSDFYIKNEFICLKKYKLNLPQNGEDFKILRTLLLKKQAVRHEELWRELYNEDCRNINLKV